MEMQNKIDRKKQILEAALKIFIKKGYAKTTMDDIVGLSGLSKGALYHYYKSKKDLFLDLIDHWEVYTFKNFYQKSSKYNSASNTIRLFGQNVLKTLKNKKIAYLAEVEFLSLSNHDLDIKHRSQLLYDKLLNLFEKVVAKGIKQGEFKELDIRTTAMFIIAVFQGINWFAIFEENSVSAESYIENSIDLIINSISK
jgi:AcrR family transcriptional regulator